MIGSTRPWARRRTLQLEAAHARHLHISDQARRIVHLRRLQELAGRRKRMSDVSKRSHEPVGRGADGRIIIDDRNHRNLGQISPSFVSWPAQKQSVPAPRHNAPRRSGGKSYLGFDALGLRAPNSEHFGHSDQIGQRPCAHFSHEVPAMNLHSNLGQTRSRPRSACSSGRTRPAPARPAHEGSASRKRRAAPQRFSLLCALCDRARSPAATASSMSWSRNGLVRKSTAPAFMAFTVIGISPWPVMKIIGIWIFVLASSA